MYPYLLSLAITLEASAYPKPGNIHRLYSNSGNFYEKFLSSSHLSTKWFTRGYRRGFVKWRRVVFGDLIYYCSRDIVKHIGKNDHLGAITLLIPLSVNIGYCVKKGSEDPECFTNVRELLEYTTIYDSVFFYKAIRATKPSHLKPLETREYVDVWSKRYVKELFEKKHRLIDILRYSSRVEIVHDELLSNYSRSIEALNELKNCLDKTSSWNKCVVYTYLYLLSKHVDTLIVRKHGLETALEVSREASEVVESFNSNNKWLERVYVFDNKLKSRGVNPGSIADITASTIALYLIERYVNNEYLIPS